MGGINSYIWMAVEDGDGVSGMNADAEAIDVYGNDEEEENNDEEEEENNDEEEEEEENEEDEEDWHDDDEDWHDDDEDWHDDDEDWHQWLHLDGRGGWRWCLRHERRRRGH